MSQEQPDKMGMRKCTNPIWVLLTAHATSITIFFRNSFGKEALGWPGVFAFLLILIVGGLNKSPVMLLYLGVWLVALACQRLCTFRLVCRGGVWHSKYEGWPVLAVKLAFGNPKVAVFVVEPLLCLAGVTGRPLAKMDKVHTTGESVNWPESSVSLGKTGILEKPQSAKVLITNTTHTADFGTLSPVALPAIGWCAINP